MNRRSLPGEHRRNGGRVVEWPPTNCSGGRDRGVVFARITQKEESEDADERS
jgi:hypothetical protein